MSNNLNDNITPENLARYFKFYQQAFIRNKKIIPFTRIRPLTFYRNNAKIFDKLYEICNKYNIRGDKYVKFSVEVNGKGNNPKDLLTVQNFVAYSNYLKQQDQYQKIYEYYKKSANNIADECIARGWNSSSEYIRYVISENKLGYHYITGKISKYFIASIQNFKQLFEKLDQQNKDELSIIYKVSDELNSAVQSAFKIIEKRTVTPVSFTDAIIENKKLNK